MDKQQTLDEIPFAKAYTGQEEEEAVIKTLRSGWLTTGKECLEFEKEFADFLEGIGDETSPLVPNPRKITCLAVNSATSGLHLALEACGIKAGDKVLLPSLTFTSSAEVIRYLGADPVFVDVKPGTFHIDPLAIERTLEKIKPGKAKAVMPVHYGGLLCDMNEIMAIAGRFNLKVIEDAAHSFPSLVGDRGAGINGQGVKSFPQSPIPSPRSPVYAGTIGDAGVFSFYATKTITTGEGGMIATGDPELAKRISIMRSHGIDRSIWNRYTDTGASWYYEVVAPGFKYNMSDLLASIGRVQLRRSNALLNQRKAIAEKYDSEFKGDRHFTLPPTGEGDARHLYPLRINPQTLKINRNEFIEELKSNGIGVSVHFIPLHIMPYYKKQYDLSEKDLPETMSVFKSEISLPIWPGMTDLMVDKVITVVKTLAIKYTK